MIQFNLLPDVKLDFIRAKRLKRTFVTLSMLVIAVSAGIVLILVATVYGWQRTRINNLTDDIAEIELQIQSIEQIDRILTVQNQLRTVNQLHDEKPVSSRLFEYVESLTPSNVALSKVEIDFEANTLQVEGTADDFASINKFVDTLKFVEYAATDINDDLSELADADQSLIQPDRPSSQRVFSGVVLSSFDISEDDASYTITMQFVPEIFNSRFDVTLIIQDKITTRSELEKPSALFSEPTGVQEPN